MERYFVRRMSAVAFLLDRRREWFEKISLSPTDDVEFETQQLDLIDQLVFDVRAGRVDSFELHHPTPVAMFISD
jgi:hypothetical protein